MTLLPEHLLLPRCPHCGIANPNLRRTHHAQTSDHAGQNTRIWSVYVCGSCGGMVSAWASNHNQAIGGYYPNLPTIEDEIPNRPRAYLKHAAESLHAPAGAIMLAASAVDAMLKAKGNSEGRSVRKNRSSSCQSPNHRGDGGLGTRNPP